MLHPCGLHRRPHHRPGEGGRWPGGGIVAADEVIESCDIRPRRCGRSPNLRLATASNAQFARPDLQLLVGAELQLKPRSLEWLESAVGEQKAQGQRLLAVPRRACRRLELLARPLLGRWPSCKNQGAALAVHVPQTGVLHSDEGIRRRIGTRRRGQKQEQGEPQRQPNRLALLVSPGGRMRLPHEVVGGQRTWRAARRLADHDIRDACPAAARRGPAGATDAEATGHAAAAMPPEAIPGDRSPAVDPQGRVLHGDGGRRWRTASGSAPGAALRVRGQQVRDGVVVARDGVVDTLLDMHRDVAPVHLDANVHV
mmetsp:Transcript_62564/g.181380  ORF Transcript_62564/g.181380 Transcript_62564/m.181380 type:complete len:312 (+) Transcript_62564:135-1070(+)